MKEKPVIAINARFLIKGKLEGIGWYSFETIRRIVRDHPEYQFDLLFDREPDPEFVFEGCNKVVLAPQARHPFLWYIWFEFSLSRYLKKRKPVAFLSPDGYACLSTDVPQTIVMHDLAFEHFPEQVPGLVFKYYKKYMPQFAKKASQIATVSEYSKQDISKRYGIDPANITVTYNGSNEAYKPLADEERKALKQQISNGEPYFVYIGSMHPRKNVEGLMKAFEQFKQESGQKHKLYLIGRMAWQTGAIKVQLDKMQFRDDVIFCGHLEPQSLYQTLACSNGLVYVSWFEGFGIPILEALACDVPVICSNTSSMPEVGGEAALLVDPGNSTEIASAMNRLATDEALRADLIEKGRGQRERFSWEISAEKLWSAVARTLA